MQPEQSRVALQKTLRRSPSSARWCSLYSIQRVSYTRALSLQRDLHDRCATGEIPGALLLLEHDPVITMGVKTAEHNILASEQALHALGIELVRTDRGGDATYHGPGQLVGYPILRLRDLGLDVHGYLRALEQCIIDVLAGFGLSGRRNGPAGVWVGERKVCSIGIAIRRQVTYHGFALNVDPDMSHFRLINPCGLAPHSITSLAELLHAPPEMHAVREACAREFARTFNVELVSRGESPC